MKPSSDLTTQAVIIAHFFFSVFQVLDSTLVSAQLVMTSVRPRLGKTYVTTEQPPSRATLGTTLMRAMTSRQPKTWKLLSICKGCQRLLLSSVQGWRKVPKHDQALAKWHSLWTPSCSLKALYNEKKNWRGYPVEGDFFKGLARNGSTALQCMVWNHFVAFSVCYCVIIAEFARYDEKNGRGYPVVDMSVALLWNNSVSAQRLFCR